MTMLPLFDSFVITTATDCSAAVAITDTFDTHTENYSPQKPNSILRFPDIMQIF
jgi:hypothetical protein